MEININVTLGDNVIPILEKLLGIFEGPNTTAINIAPQEAKVKSVVTPAPAVVAQAYQQQAQTPAIPTFTPNPVMPAAFPMEMPNPGLPPDSMIPVQTMPVTAIPVAAAPTYTLDQLARAGVAIADSGKRDDVLALLKNRFGIAGLTALPKERYGEYATCLRALGAKI